MLVPSTYDKMSMKSKRCKQCNKHVVQTESDLQKSSPFAFASLLIHYIPQIYFLACRFYDTTTGDAFLEVINTTENTLKITIEPYTKEELEITARIMPIEETIDLSTKESMRDELGVIDDISKFQKLPKVDKSVALKCKKNYAIIQLFFTKDAGQDRVVVRYKI